MADADAAWEVIAVEQLLNSMPVTVRVWVAERKPKIVEGSKRQDPQEGPRGAGARQCHKCPKVTRPTPVQVASTGPSSGTEAKICMQCTSLLQL